jgi:hypothetical protein
MPGMPHCQHGVSPLSPLPPTASLPPSKDYPSVCRCAMQIESNPSVGDARCEGVWTAGMHDAATRHRRGPAGPLALAVPCTLGSCSPMHRGLPWEIPVKPIHPCEASIDSTKQAPAQPNNPEGHDPATSINPPRPRKTHPSVNVPALISPCPPVPSEHAHTLSLARKPSRKLQQTAKLRNTRAARFPHVLAHTLTRVCLPPVFSHLAAPMHRTPLARRGSPW